MLELAELVVELNALEVVNHHEVDNTGDRVGTVGGGGAAGQHFNALDQGRRDLVDVGTGTALQR